MYAIRSYYGLGEAGGGVDGAAFSIEFVAGGYIQDRWAEKLEIEGDLPVLGFGFAALCEYLVQAFALEALFQRQFAVPGDDKNLQFIGKGEFGREQYFEIRKGGALWCAFGNCAFQHRITSYNVCYTKLLRM